MAVSVAEGSIEPTLPVLEASLPAAEMAPPGPALTHRAPIVAIADWRVGVAAR